MKKKLQEIKHYKEAALPSVLEPNVVYYVLDDVFNAVRGYITTKDGVPIPFIDIQGSGSGSVSTVTGTGVTGTASNPVIDISTFVSGQLGNLIQLSEEDGKLVVNPITSNTLEITEVDDELQIELSNAIVSQIVSALQPGDNISVLVNDVGYVTIADIPPFDPSDYDLEDFNNLSSDPFARLSDLPGGTDLAYVPSPIKGTITSSSGTSADIPLEDGTNAGLLSPTKSSLIDSAVQPTDLATVAFTGDYNDLINTPSAGIVSITGNDGVIVDDSDPQNLEIDLGNITPINVSASGTVTGYNLSGNNTGDQTSIVGISGTKTQYNASLTDGDFLFTGDAEVPLIFSSPLSRVGNTVSIPQANSSTNGFLSSSDWSTFNNKGNAQTANPLSQFAPTTSSQLAGVITDETGTGNLVFSNSPTLISPTVGTAANLNNSTIASSTAYVWNNAITDVFRNGVTGADVVGSIAEVIVSSVAIPANTFKTGTIWDVFWDLEKPNTDNGGTIRVYVNSVNSLSGATAIGMYTFVQANRNLPFHRRGVFDSATTMWGGSAASLSLITNNIVQNSVFTAPYNTANIGYFLFTSTSLSATNIIRQKSLTIRISY